ncbi:hypothetical protein GF354_00780 [Candidatus Peregrinibacteria bacterium]|nr:hypothetical protein [Candidatus Peregrinibacteria bacterium]
MSKRVSSIVIIVIFGVLSCGVARGESGITGFISATVGTFNIKFPQSGPGGEQIGEEVGFDDVYGSKNGLSYGIEGGIGNYEQGIFGVVKYRYWKKPGTPEFYEYGDIDISVSDSKAEWSQYFIMLGPRYFVTSQLEDGGSILPFLGGGLVYTRAKEFMEMTFYYENDYYYTKAENEVDGLGFYVEAGIDLLAGSNASLRGTADYSFLKLKGKYPDGTTVEIDGGGGLFIGASLNFFIK